MSDHTAISWCDATWNPVRGCRRVSEGCRHCFGAAIAARFSGPGLPFEGLAEMTANGPRWTGTVSLLEDKLVLPLCWRRPRKVFVDSMTDLFYEAVPFNFIDRVWATMLLAPRHRFLLLTKRPERMREYLGRPNLYDAVLREANRIRRTRPELTGVGISNPARFPAPWIWLGTSVERQREADERIPHLLACPAAVRFLSCEPMLGSISLERWLADYDSVWGEPLCPKASPGLHWVIVGGESGPGFRPMELDWARDLRDECQSCDVAFWFKQHAGIRPGMNHMLDGQVWQQFPRTEVPA